MVKEKKVNNVLRIIIIFSLVFIMIPLGIFTLFYFSNNNFKEATNNYLRGAPGFIGNYFEKYPTESEVSEKVSYLSNYYLSLDAKSAADKLYIIKNDDDKLYNDIVVIMNSRSSATTSQILKQVRNIELRKDLLFSIYEEIRNEEDSQFSNQVKEFENIDLKMAINKLEELYHASTDDNNFNYISKLFTSMDTNRAADLLFYINDDIRKALINSLNSSKKDEYELLLKEQHDTYNELLGQSNIYEVKTAEEGFNDIGSTTNYSIEELAIIYMNLSVDKSSEILIKVDDEEFIKELFESIMKQESLLNKDTSITINISKAMNYLNVYDNKVNELVHLYEKMNIDEVTSIVEKMVNSQNRISVLEINNTELYEVTDSKLIIDVLRRMKTSTLSQILNRVTPSKATDITRRLAEQ